MLDVAVIITCHKPYFRWLPEAMASIDQQVPTPVERVIAFDGCTPPPFINQDWQCITGNWGHPSGGRNAGLKVTAAPWLIFLDADNVAPRGYLAALKWAISMAAPNVGIIYPDILYCDETLEPRALRNMPIWDYWRMREQNCVDTSSAWRREAIELAGGWSLGNYGAHEDYGLALDITAARWKAVHLEGPAIRMREHADGRLNQRRRDGGVLTDLWKARSLGIVSLLAGRMSSLDRWTQFLLTAELPPKTALYIVDNSGNSNFTRRALDACMRVAAQRALCHLDYALIGQPYKSDVSEMYLAKRRHLHVAGLYSKVLPRVTEDLVLTLEDDVEPPLDAVRRLGEEFGYPKIGAVAAAYPDAGFAGFVCAGLGTEGWGPTVNWQDLPFELIDVGCVGGGCTLWANWALQDSVAHLQWDLSIGWDGVLCMDLRRNGYRVRLHGGVRCQHHIHERVQQDNGRSSNFVITPRPGPPRAALGHATDVGL
jgi:hypothetical protein